MNKVLVTGPRSNGISGGQATHMSIISTLLSPKSAHKLYFFYSSAGLDQTENFVKKIFNFIKVICSYPFAIRQVDVVHINSSFDLKAVIRDSFLVFYTWLFCKSYVLQFHGGRPSKMNFLAKCLNLLTLKFFSRKAKFICLTNEQVDWLKKSINKDVYLARNFVQVPSKKTSFNYNAKLRFLYMGRIVREKGVFSIVDAVNILSQTNSNFEVYICGSGNDSKILSEYIIEKNAEEYIKFIGSVKGFEKEKIFGMCDVFLYPTKYPEGLPYSILEALSYTMPVVSTTAGSIPDVVLNNINGIILKENTPSEISLIMNNFIEDRNLLKDFGLEGWNLIDRNHSITAMVEFFDYLWNFQDDFKSSN
jgi:glycosyltransferase involved in cell wall biosynthesis